MRLDINLASQPYEDSRQFWLRWGTGLAGAAILTLGLLTITISGWYSARRDHVKIAEFRSQIAQRDRTREQAEAFLNRPENRTTRDQSKFLNQLIERKSLSWTYVLEDLEKVMPSRVHLVSIHPELSDENQLTLKMVVAGDSRDKALELARRMEDSRRFAQTYIASENAAPTGSGDTIQFDINGIYVPQAAPAAAPAPKTAEPKVPGVKLPVSNTAAPKTSAPGPAKKMQTPKPNGSTR
jgi:type IV pilus assembly protein PilN